MKGKRILSAVLSAALLLQLSPLAVFAEDTSLLPVTAQTAQTEPAPEETAVPMAAPTPEPTAEPTATPAPEETAAPDAAETPAPEPSAEPTAAPDPAAEVQALIDALPDEVTEDNAEAVEQALTAIDDAKQSHSPKQIAIAVLVIATMILRISQQYLLSLIPYSFYQRFLFQITA